MRWVCWSGYLTYKQLVPSCSSATYLTTCHAKEDCPLNIISYILTFKSIQFSPGLKMVLQDQSKFLQVMWQLPLEQMPKQELILLNSASYRLLIHIRSYGLFLAVFTFWFRSIQFFTLYNLVNITS